MQKFTRLLMFIKHIWEQRKEFLKQQINMPCHFVWHNSITARALGSEPFNCYAYATIIIIIISHDATHNVVVVCPFWFICMMRFWWEHNKNHRQILFCILNKRRHIGGMGMNTEKKTKGNTKQKKWEYIKSKWRDLLVYNLQHK